MNADQLSYKMAAIKNSNSYDSSQTLNKATITGAGIGGMFGLYYGYTRKKNMLIMGVAGALVGGIFTRLIMPK